ncbi:MAG: ParB-like partition protein [Paenibacillaceae bacterium]|jgi:ParB family chromosome partitioning protein|nr:ParB-like partition protein [Paenibacillaceae bacterium]
MKEQITRLFGLAEKNTVQEDVPEEVRLIPVSEIVPNPHQPRTVFEDERIEELSQSIKTHGVIQPIVVRKRNGKFEIIAGERRWRASCKLGLDTIPAIVREMNDSQSASIALIENLQREGLTSIEEALAYQQLMEIHSLTQESLAQRLGKSQSTIANKIRLLHLSDQVKQALLNRTITERHARALLALHDEELQLKVLQEIISKDLNVKQTETRVNYYKESLIKTKTKRASFSKDVRLAVNTIRQSVEMVANSGMKIHTSEIDQGEHYEIIIRIPKRNMP